MENKAVCFLLVLVTIVLLLQITSSTAESGQATLSWTAPTTYTDGTPMTQVAGYKVHIGQASCSYQQHIDVGDVTTYSATDLPDGSTYYFAVTAYDASRSESAYSNEVIKSIPTPVTYLITATYGRGGAITAVENGNITTKTGNNSTTTTVTVNDGASQVFAITAENGYVIGDVTVDGASVGAVSSYTFDNVVANHTIGASFVSKSFTITASADVGGTITPSGTTTVQAGGTQTYRISAAKDYKIADVKIDGVSIGAVPYYTFSNVRSNHTIQATFATALTYTITASTGTGGAITPPGAVTVPAGSSQTFAIAASDGFAVADVKVDGASVGPVTTYTFTNVTADHTIEATFSGMNYTVTASAGTGGTITPSGVVAIPTGGSQTFSIGATAGYSIADVKVDGTSVGPVDTYTFSNVTANHTIEASFSGITFTIAASAGTGGTITPAGAVTVPYGGSRTFTIAASAGYSIADVKVDGVSAGPVTTYTFSNVTADHTIEGSFSAVTYTITASAGTGGTITPSGAVTVPEGGSQTFTIAASAGYGIADVKVDGASVGAVTTYTFSNVTANHTIQASFGAVTYTITAAAGTGGTITPSGAVTVPEGGSQTFTIAASAGYGIADVRVDGVSVGAVTTHTFSNVTANHTIEASYSAITYTITASAGTGGSINPSGAVTVPAGANQAFTIAASAGYRIADVKVDGASVGAPTTYTFTSVNTNHTIEASFGVITYTITASAGTGGSIAPSGTVSVASGGNQSYTITASPGYSIADVKADGVSVGPQSTYTFSNVTANHTIEAGFQAVSYTISASAGSGGSITPSGTVTVPAGGSQTFTIAPSAGYGITDVKVDGASVGPVSTYTFSNVTASRTIQASFGGVDYTITSSAGTGGTIAPSGTVTVPSGGSQAYTISASPGYRIADVKVDGASIGAPSSYTFSNVTASHTIDASFSVITYAITATAGTGGTITPSGTASVPSGGSQTYTVAASAGYRIADVKVDGTSVGTVSTYTFSNVTTNHTIEASFSVATFTITATAGTGGSISPPGAATVPAGGSQSYTVAASAGYRIADVRVDGTSVGAVSTYTFSNVTANHTIDASFSVVTYSITATAGTGGTITPSGTATVPSGGSQTYMIAASAGYRIADVKVDGASVGAVSTHTFSNVTANHTIDATFSVITFSITATAGTGGTIAPAGTTTVPSGGSQAYTIAASSGYRISDVRVDGASVGAVSTYTFSNVAANHTIDASFSVLTYTITATAGTGGTIAPAGTATIPSGGGQSYTITALTGYRISDVKVDGASVGAVSTYTFSNVTASHTIDASFSALTGTDLGINSGGPQYTNTAGFVYRADQYYSGGSTRTTTAAILGTAEAPLYQNSRDGGSFSYAIPLTNGNYNVTFKFAETQYSAPRKRVFSVKIGSTTVISNLDIYAMAGRNTAYDVVVPTTVANGTLSISFVRKNSTATVCALKIVAAASQARAAGSAPASAPAAAPQHAAAAVSGETYILPSDRSVNWTGNVGVTGDIPVRTATCATVAPSGADDTSAIKQAIANCPPGQVVALATGTFHVASPIAVKSDITLRGAGMGATVIRGAAGMIGPYLVGFDAGPFYDASLAVSSDLTKGSTSITTGTGHGWSVGDVVLIDQLNSQTGDPVISNVGTSGTCTWCGRGNGARSLGQLNKIAAVPTPTSATLEWPLVWNYSSSLAPQATRINGITANAGIEDMTIDNGASGSMNQSDDGGTIAFYGASNSWLLRVEAKGSYRTMVRIKRGYRNTIRSCKFHEGVPSLPPNGLSYDTSRAYGVWIGPGSANLAENNKLYHLYMPFKLDSTTTGNVISYNYISDLYYTNANWNLGTVQFHGGHPAMNLVEGNHGAGRMLADDIWGSSSHNTFFRNRAALAPGKTGAPWDFDLQKNATYYNVVGNVIGTPGVESVYQFNNVSLTAQPSIFRLGYVSDGDKDASGNDPQVAATLLLQGNWDSVNNGTVWNGPADTLAATMYLPGKPAWWGGMQWPAVGPDISPMFPPGPGICNGMPWEDSSIPSSSIPSRPGSPTIQ